VQILLVCTQRRPCHRSWTLEKLADAVLQATAGQAPLGLIVVVGKQRVRSLVPGYKIKVGGQDRDFAWTFSPSAAREAGVSVRALRWMALGRPLRAGQGRPLH
jgi:hypothetical protein